MLTYLHDDYTPINPIIIDKQEWCSVTHYVYAKLLNDDSLSLSKKTELSVASCDVIRAIGATVAQKQHWLNGTLQFARIIALYMKFATNEDLYNNLMNHNEIIMHYDERKQAIAIDCELMLIKDVFVGIPISPTHTATEPVTIVTQSTSMLPVPRIISFNNINWMDNLSPEDRFICGIMREFIAYNHCYYKSRGGNKMRHIRDKSNIDVAVLKRAITPVVEETIVWNQRCGNDKLPTTLTTRSDVSAIPERSTERVIPYPLNSMKKYNAKRGRTNNHW
jgi:hypothetical protein